uniref:Uncharacterized protein n=1 Tax=Romanomermis culicivorax TaxID=13658 RepID=A0A915L0K1_ROMCU
MPEDMKRYMSIQLISIGVAQCAQSFVVVRARRQHYLLTSFGLTFAAGQIDHMQFGRFDVFAVVPNFHHFQVKMLCDRDESAFIRVAPVARFFKPRFIKSSHS